METVLEHPHEGAAAPGPDASVAGPEPAVLRILEPHFAGTRFPWTQVWGYVGSLGLTLAAFGLVAHHLLPPTLLLAVVLALAAGQASLQLGVFMHLRESRGPAWQVLPLGLSFAIAIGMIVASLWIMAFKWGVS